MAEVLCVHHVGLTVADLATSTAFYCSCGYAVAERVQVDGPDGAIGNGLDKARLDIAFLSSASLTLELVEFDPAGPPIGADAPAFGCIPVPRMSAPLRDPDGRRILPIPTGPPTIRFTTSDVPGTARLLSLLGLELDGGTVLSGHGLTVELTAVEEGLTTAANRPGRSHLCCQVARMTDAVDELDAAGFKMVSTPRVQGGLQWAFVRHDGGPGVELLQIGEPS